MTTASNPTAISPTSATATSATAASATAASATAGGVRPAGASPRLVYAIGALGYDFGTYARRDAFEANNGELPLITNPDLSNYLVGTPVDAENVIWTLNLDSTPVYAVMPNGPFAKHTYQKLQSYLVDPNIDLLLVVGAISGSITLLNGQTVPIIEPIYEGLSAWSPERVLAPIAELDISPSVLPKEPRTQVYLTGEGYLDWNHWGLNLVTDRNRKLSVSLPGVTIGRQIDQSLWTATRQLGFACDFLWTDGTPTRNYTPGPLLVSGFLSVGPTNEFQLTLPADTTPRVLKLFVRAGGTCSLTATLTGMAPVTDTRLYGMGTPGDPFVDGVYTIAYRLASGTGSLTLVWRTAGGTSAGLQAAALQGGMLVRPPALQSFLDRIHFGLRNLGTSSAERALNFAATYATTQLLPRFGGTLFAAMYAQGMQLESFEVTRSPECRPRGDCWDVIFKFFNPASNVEWARTFFRATIDVSQVKPLLLAPLQRWSEQ